MPIDKDQTHIVEIDYTNWQGVRRLRRIRPMYIAHEANKWHPDKQWLLYALNETGVPRTFSMLTIHSWKHVAPP